MSSSNRKKELSISNSRYSTSRSNSEEEGGTSDDPSLVEGKKLQLARRNKGTTSLLTINGLGDESARPERHVHCQTDHSDGRKQRSVDIGPDSHMIGKTDGRSGGGSEGGSGGGSEGGSGGGSGEGSGEGSGGGSGGGSGEGSEEKGVRPLSGRRLISVKPFSATPGEEDPDDDKEEEEKEKKKDACYDDRQRKRASFTKVASGVAPKSAVDVTQVKTPQTNIHADLPVIDLESETCMESDVEHLRCVIETSVVRPSGSRPDPVKPKSFLNDVTGKNDDVTITPAVEIDVATVVEPFDGGTTAIRRTPASKDRPTDATSSTAAAAPPVAAAGLVAANASGSSSSSQPLDTSVSLLHGFQSDPSILPDPIGPEESTPFARVESEDFLGERGEGDGKESPPRIYVPPRSISDMILTTRPSRVSLLYSPAPPRTRILFRITRHKVCFSRLYHAHLELNAEKILYMEGGKLGKSRTSYMYVLSSDQNRSLLDSFTCVGQLRSNYMGTMFTLYYTAGDTLTSSSKDSRTPGGHAQARRQNEELASVIYTPNPLGFYGPRRMTVILPALTESADRLPQTSHSATQQEDKTLLGRYKAKQMKDLIVLHNKPPIWIEAKNAYMLNFHGRVTKQSVKNFQLVPSEDHNDIVMQFGRIGKNSFTMDFRRPLSAVQAFGIVLSCFDCIRWPASE